ncbi:hypothetical protein ABH920_009187 [Catenulispora sp. EB89]|uniref:hypothetical protein n=1 Tax=Catenulispora sp. EB89 TaxID=3156257 RepID=UPI003516F6C8
MSVTSSAAVGALGIRWTMADIATFAQVKRPVVSNWRRRHQDFPQQVAVTSSGVPLFDAEQVVDWLVGTGRTDEQEARAELAAHCITEVANTVPGLDALDLATALITLGYQSGEQLAAPDDAWESHRAALVRLARDADPGDAMLAAEIAALPSAAAPLLPIVDEFVEAAWTHRQAIERILAARNRLGRSDLSEDAVAEPVARLMARLCGAVESANAKGDVTVADPVAGVGDLLNAVMAVLPEDASTYVIATEPAAGSVRILRRRLTVRADVAGVAVNAHGAAVGTADSIVCRMPFVPAEQADPAAVVGFVAELAAELDPGQVAVVLASADVFIDSLRRTPHTRRMEPLRRKLLASGAVEAVIALPGGALPFRPGYETAIVVLAPTANTDPALRRSLLLAEVSGRPLTDDVVETLVSEVTTWRRIELDHRMHSFHLARPTPLSVVTAIGATLRPRPLSDEATVARAAQRATTRIFELELALDGFAEAGSPPKIKTGVIVRDKELRPRRTVAEMVQIGLIKVLPAPPGLRVQPEHYTPDGSHPVIGAGEVTGTARPGSRRVTPATVGEHYSRARLTLPGDVIVTTTPKFGVLLDADGGSLVEAQVRVLRIADDRDRSLTPRVLAEILRASTAPGRAEGAVRATRRLEEWEIPLLTPDETARLDTILATLDARRAALDAERAALDDLGAVVAGGLADGTLTFPAPPRSIIRQLPKKGP